MSYKKSNYNVAYNKSTFTIIYIIQYTIIYGFMLMLNRIFGVEIPTASLSQIIITALIMGMPLMFLVIKFEIPRWAAVVFGILHYFIISIFLNII